MRTIHIPLEIRKIFSTNPEAILIISLSGGKDSQAMASALYAYFKKMGWMHRVIAIHCDVGTMEWAESHDYARMHGETYAHEFKILNSAGDLLDGIYKRYEKKPSVPSFPDAGNRWCTSTYKRDVTDADIRRHFPSDATVVVATGLRDEESKSRKEKPDCWERGSHASAKLHRNVYDWIPIRHWTLEDVWAEIGYTLPELATLQAQFQAFKQANDTLGMEKMIEEFKAHSAYLKGNERVSCALCVLASLNDLKNGAEWQPETYRKLCEAEIKTGYSFKNKFWLGLLRPDLLPPEWLPFYADKTNGSPKKVKKPKQLLLL